jgi:hypothetical protein
LEGILGTRAYFWFFVDFVEPDHRASGRPLPVSDDCVSAGLVDEWLQVRNELSIEIFCGTPPFRRLPGLLRVNASSTASSGETGAFAASLRHPGFVDAVHPIVAQPSMRRRCTVAGLASSPP